MKMVEDKINYAAVMLFIAMFMITLIILVGTINKTSNLNNKIEYLENQNKEMSEILNWTQEEYIKNIIGLLHTCEGSLNYSNMQLDGARHNHEWCEQELDYIENVELRDCYDELGFLEDNLDDFKERIHERYLSMRILNCEMCGNENQLPCTDDNGTLYCRKYHEYNENMNRCVPVKPKNEQNDMYNCGG